MSRDGRAIHLAGAAALLSLAALAMPAQADAPAAGPIEARAFAAPDGPMVLTRMLRRPLREGKEIISFRSYLVRFVPEGGGFLVEGELLAVTVEAPPGLQALAEIERKRPDDGLFPMRLDAAGVLLEAAGATGPGASQRQAAEQVSRDIGGLHHLGPADSAQAQAFVARLGAGVGHTPWPRDLFRPAPGAGREVRVIPLLNGGRGHVTVDRDAKVTDGRLASFSRRVTTEMDGDVRVTIEEWTLVRAPAT